MQITLEKLKEWEACYYDEFTDVADADEMLLRWSGGRRSMSVLEVMELDAVSVEDRLWVAIRALNKKDRRLFACDCAEHVLPIYEKYYPDDSRPREAIETMRRYARGEATKEELEIANNAAYAAANAVADDADDAWAAANSAADAAANNAASAAANAAWAAADAADAADAAARAAARDAEREWQLERVKCYLGESCKSR
jgi:hypothetical protein